MLPAKLLALQNHQTADKDVFWALKGVLKLIFFRDFFFNFRSKEASCFKMHFSFYLLF